jgi:hypothetical protein
MRACEYRSGRVLGDPIADLRGNALLEQVAQEAWKWCRNGDQHPKQQRNNKTGDGHPLERNRNWHLAQDMDMQIAEIGDRLYAVNYRRREKERDDGHGTDRKQQNVDHPGPMLPGTAMGTIRKVLIVVRAHRRREPRYVVPPTGENVSDHRVRAMSSRQAA